MITVDYIRVISCEQDGAERAREIKAMGKTIEVARERL